MATVAKPVAITGLDAVLRNLNREIKGIRNRSRSGLWQAALVIQKRSQELTPVKYGNLKASAGSYAYNTSKGPGAVIYYTASYAVFVHEIDKNYTVGQWKFLETAIKEKKAAVLDIIRRTVRIGRIV